MWTGFASERRQHSTNDGKQGHVHETSEVIRGIQVLLIRKIPGLLFGTSQHPNTRLKMEGILKVHQITFLCLTPELRVEIWRNRIATYISWHSNLCLTCEFKHAISQSSERFDDLRGQRLAPWLWHLLRLCACRLLPGHVRTSDITDLKAYPH